MQKHFDKTQCRQKGVSTLIGIIIIVAVAVVAFGGVFAYSYFTTKTNNQSFVASTPQDLRTAGPALSEVEGWKTYKNDEYGFGFQYPTDWKINAGGSGLNVYLESSDGRFKIKIYKSVLSSETFGYEGVESRQILVDKYEATKSIMRGVGEIASKDSYAIVTNIYDKEIFYEGDIYSQNLEEFSETYDQILSTFKFIK